MYRATSRVQWEVRDWPVISPSTSERELFRLTKQLPEMVWNAAALEGNTFTLPEVRTLLDGVTVGGKKLAEQQQVLDLSDAFNELHRLVREGAFLADAPTSHRLHELVARHEALESGQFRGQGAASSEGGGVRLMNGGFVPFDPEDELSESYEDLIDSLQSLANPVERALAYFCSATRSQYYFDGNKRTARLVASGMLMREGYPALNIPHARRLEFNIALDELFSSDAADAHAVADASELMEFLYDCLAA